MTEETSAAPVAPPSAPVFIGDKSRVETVALDWPLSYGGKTYASITLKRMTTAEVADFIDRMRKAGEAATARFPIFVDEAGAPIPDEVMDGLDADDMDRLNERAANFLPRRFLGAPASASPAPTGATTGRS